MTKVIISHDVDHISPWEHGKDLVIPKHVGRSLIEMFSGNISSREIGRRLGEIARGKWQNLEEVMEIDGKKGIPSTFFMSVANGKGISYPVAAAEFWIRRIAGKGFDVGVHGIAYEESEAIEDEKKTFREIAGPGQTGIRMHYLRRSDSTLDLLSAAGYLYDSSVFGMFNPFKVGGMWEFPLHIMDGCIFCHDARWQNRGFLQAREATKEIIEEAAGRGMEYLTILFHDRYFSDSFSAWKEWYIWLLEYLQECNLGFISYRGAVMELEGEITGG